MFTVSIELKYYLIGCMKLPMNFDIYSIGFVFETIWRCIVGHLVAPQVRVTKLKWPLGGLSNLFIFISGWLHIWTPYSRCKQVFWKIGNKQICVTPWECLRIMQNLSQKTHARHSRQVLKNIMHNFWRRPPWPSG